MQTSLINTSTPKHIAIIMDGNNRWTKQRFLPKFAGHRAAAKNLEKVVRRSVERGVEYLTLFAFSWEKWNRPANEVRMLMKLLLTSLSDDTGRLHDNGIRLNVIGDRSRLSDDL